MLNTINYFSSRLVISARDSLCHPSSLRQPGQASGQYSVHAILRGLINGSAVPGFAFLASIIAIFSGGQLITLGIMGEYLARIYTRSMEQPPYFVRETTMAEIQKET